ncbi:hypothetical protein, partial [Burkholderia pseudomallei]|uniref:hypothetical protein n=1 Tax=Burkholderia pseudomallei TaxID=28450 RepID=UPI000CDDB4B7
DAPLAGAAALMRSSRRAGVARLPAYFFPPFGPIHRDTASGLAGRAACRAGAASATGIVVASIEGAS